jgi:hypothetical protein
MRAEARRKNLFYDSYYDVKQIMPAPGWHMLTGEPTMAIGDDGEEEDGGMAYQLRPVQALALARLEPPEDPSEWECPRYHNYTHLNAAQGSLAGWDIVGMDYHPNGGWSVVNRYPTFICLVAPGMTMQEALDALGPWQLGHIEKRIRKELDYGWDEGSPSE